MSGSVVLAGAGGGKDARPSRLRCCSFHPTSMSARLAGTGERAEEVASG